MSFGPDSVEYQETRFGDTDDIETTSALVFQVMTSIKRESAASCRAPAQEASASAFS